MLGLNLYRLVFWIFVTSRLLNQTFKLINSTERVHMIIKNLSVKVKYSKATEIRLFPPAYCCYYIWWACFSLLFFFLKNLLEYCIIEALFVHAFTRLLPASIVRTIRIQKAVLNQNSFRKLLVFTDKDTLKSI